MTTSSPVSPRLHRGALVGVDLFNPLASLILFQYNPETLGRTLAPSAVLAQEAEDQAEALRIHSPPTETISVDIQVDATDQLDEGDGTAQSLGVHPSLAALEMLLYPKSLDIIGNELLNLGGILEVIPRQAPLTLFVWGIKRVLPVRVTQMSITEEFFDPTLNPIRAAVHLEMRVLNYRDLGFTSPGGAIFLAHHILKETMATIHGLGTLSSTASFSVSGGLSL